MSQLRVRWPKYWSFSFSIILSKEHPGMISFKMDQLDFLAVQGTVKSLLQHQFKSINSSALILLYGPALTSIHVYRTIALPIWTFVSKIMSLHFNTRCSEVKASACNAGDLGSIPGSGRSPGEGNGHPLRYSCLENPMDRGAWWATVHGVAKSRT